MPVPITPTPARPTPDAIVASAWGTWAHDVALALPRGVVAAGTAPGVNFSSTTPDQFTKTFPSEAGRAYEVVCYATWYASVVNACAWDVYVNSVLIAGWKQTAAAVGLTPIETASIRAYVVPGVTLAACPFRLRSARVSGSATFTVSPWTWAVYDVGPAIPLAATSAALSEDSDDES